ncbi:MAG: sugar kinase [Alphaproteobacteria bacterium]|nr:sugar kinase [Alphaproteobacteria bacterium]
MNFDILAMGEPMVEFNQTGGPGSRDYLQGFGGDSSNFAIAAARQGATAGYVTALGADIYGRMFRELWKAEGVDATHVREDADAFTAVYVVTHDASGHHFSFFRQGSASSRYKPADVPVDAISKAKLFHLSGISLAISASACDAGFVAMEAARKAGVSVSFDTNLRLKLWPITRARAVIAEAMALCDVCLPSYDDVAVLFGERDEDRLADMVLARGPKIVALKLGAKGTLLALPGRRVRIPPYPCKPVDATGAGDTFGGTFCARLVAGDSPEDAARYAAVAAALSTEGYGAVAPIPRAERVRAAMKAAAA